MINLDEIIGDVIFISFRDVNRFKDIGITTPSGHFLLKGYDQMGLWLEHPGIVLIRSFTLMPSQTNIGQIKSLVDNVFS